MFLLRSFVLSANAKAGYMAKYAHKISIRINDTIKGKPPKSAMATCTQLIPAPNQPKPNKKPCLAES